MEQRGGVWNRMSFETLAAAQQLAGELNTSVSVAVLGQPIDPLAADLAGKQLEKIYLVEHELLKEYTPDAYTTALGQLLAQVNPEYVLLPHTYQVRDFLPKLATALGTVAVSDVVAHRSPPRCPGPSPTWAENRGPGRCCLLYTSDAADE